MATNFPTNPNNGDTHAGFTYNSTKGVWVSSAASPSFTSLSDTPSSLGTAGQVAQVNSGATALEFADQSGGSVTVSDTAPSSPSSGDLWWHSTDLKLYVYYTDGSSNQWVQTNPSGTVSLGVDDLTDVDTTTAAPSTGQLLQWNGTNWVPYTHTNGITHLDTWRITSDITSDAIPITTWSNTAAYATLQPTLGTAMSHSSGLFTFPVTGYWEVQFFGQYYNTGSDNMGIGIQAYETDGTTLRTVSQASAGESTTQYNQINLTSYLNITNVSTQTVRFFANSIVNARLEGASDRDKTYVVFKRVGDSQ